MAFIRLDLPAPSGPIKPYISPRLDLERNARDRAAPAVALDEAVYAYQRRLGRGYQRGLAHAAFSFQRIIASAGRPGVSLCCGLLSR